MDVKFLKKCKGKEMAGPSVLLPAKKKAAELAKHALGGESQVALSLKELATVSPMMAEELILVIRESPGLKADGNHISFDVRLGEVESVGVPPVLHSDTVLCLLSYVQVCIGDHQAWEMLDSGSMVNLLPSLRHGYECKVGGLVQALEVILGRPFLFAFRAGLRYDLAQREEILSVMDSQGIRFERPSVSWRAGTGRRELGHQRVKRESREGRRARPTP
ncbi:hypothetical protein VP01_4089g1 [Puccinia sorghi]|uniref:Uncharacterized protein n=1 Tax=Puccinia sorghi TaxID=27349 RepID=A0A0L6US86_9BASI|nr:hypothetical protein VP01_4089g1 [Puccinia sorghi]